MPLDTEERIALPCDCAGVCTIVVFEEMDLDRPEVWVEHYRAWPRLRWGARLKVIAAVLRGREHTIGGVVLDDTGLCRLHSWLDARLAARGTEPGRGR